jgi:hypothetical protein
MPPQAMRLASQSTVPDSASIPVFAVVGHWRPEKLAPLVAKSGETNGENGEPTSSEHLAPHNSQLATLPSRFPHEVLLLVGQGDLFPYRIEYRRLETPPENPDGPPIPFQLSANPMVVIEFIDVAFDTPIAAGQFEYVPGDTEWTDRTATVLERLRATRNDLADRPGNSRK